MAAALMLYRLTRIELLQSCVTFGRQVRSLELGGSSVIGMVSSTLKYLIMSPSSSCSCSHVLPIYLAADFLDIIVNLGSLAILHAPLSLFLCWNSPHAMFFVYIGLSYLLLIVPCLLLTTTL